MAACAALTFGASTANAAAPTTREAAVSAYAQVAANDAVEAGWTGSDAGCVTGTEAQASLDATLRTLNLLRSFVDERAVSWDPALNSRALAAAALMRANGQLSHSPPSTWTCYTELGRSGASTSNLYLGASGSAAMVGYVLDDGVASLGHRLWALDATAVTMGTGSTGTSNALTVIGNQHAAAPGQGLVAWPPAGWISSDWFPQQWSATLQGSVDMSAVTVTMHRDGVAIPVTSVTEHTAGYGSGTSVSWVPTLPQGEDPADHTYTVTLDGGPFSARTYTVHGVAITDADLEQVRDITELTPTPTPRPSFVATPALRLNGARRPGTRVSVVVRTRNATRVTYAWERDGRVIARQARAMYVLTRLDRGHRIRVRVTLTGAGGTTVMRSAALGIPR